jgi:hypothetical protein
MGTATQWPGRVRSSRAERHAEASLRRRRWPVPLLAGLLLGQMALSMLLSSRDDAPTYDEPTHLAAGVGYLRFGQLRLNYEHPPLAKALAGVPLVLAGLDLPDRAAFREGSRPSWASRSSTSGETAPGGCCWPACR